MTRKKYGKVNPKKSRAENHQERKDQLTASVKPPKPPSRIINLLSRFRYWEPLSIFFDFIALLILTAAWFVDQSKAANTYDDFARIRLFLSQMETKGDGYERGVVDYFTEYEKDTTNINTRNILCNNLYNFCSNFNNQRLQVSELLMNDDDNYSHSDRQREYQSADSLQGIIEAIYKVRDDDSLASIFEYITRELAPKYSIDQMKVNDIDRELRIEKDKNGNLFSTLYKLGTIVLAIGLVCRFINSRIKSDSE